MPNIGPLELAIILLIVLLIFGPKRLPGLGKQLGTGMREFKDSITGKDKERDIEESSDDKSEAHEALGRPQLSRAQERHDEDSVVGEARVPVSDEAGESAEPRSAS